MSESNDFVCYYCNEYHKMINQYPLNFATHHEDQFTPRCNLHWKYQCSQCGKMIHFNGISWCSECKEFTCVSCAEEKLVRKNFLIYNYYYSIPCKTCGKQNPTLDFAEYNSSHPYQTGDIIPEEDVVVWLPIFEETSEEVHIPHSSWGIQRVLTLGGLPKMERVETNEGYTPQEAWDNLAHEWGKSWPEEGDFNHKYIILPEVYKFLDVKEGEKILDLACGVGNVARFLASKGAKVTGIDISQMIDYAMQKEEKDKLGIQYKRINAYLLRDAFEEEFFDKVVCNMALMDMDKLEPAIEQVSKVLKKRGVFVFSITHPCFSFPTYTCLRVPNDSQRNEDKIRIVLNYFDKRPVLIWDLFQKVKSPLVHYPRTLSEYINTLSHHGLFIENMSEPKPTEKIIENFPRHTLYDYDLQPAFLIIKAVKR
ncbi:MAG: class I SAM-dependent methyltransferase [Candidatus Heimdallarchaeaceae archaeon]